MYNDFISKALVKENLKRNWLMSALCFIFYFLSGPFTLLLVDKKYDYSYYTIMSTFENGNIFFCFIQCAFPVMIALGLFTYLNRVNSVNVMHAQPYSRKKLYVSNVVSGIILILIPILLTTILYVALRRPTYYYGSEVDIYTYSRVFTWMCIAIVNSIYVYAISVLACMVCANGIIAFLTACGFNLLPLALVTSFTVYIAESYFGATTESLEETIKNTHAVLKTVFDNSIPAMIIFFVIAVAILVASYFIYKVRKLERVGDAYVFGPVKHLIGFLFVYFFTLFFGLVLSGAWGVAAYPIGGILGFILGQMFSRKTFMIFDKDGLKNFVIYAVLICIILTGLFVDITGYEKRVPKADDVKSAGIELPLIDGKYNNSMKYFESPEAIKAITSIHQNIIDKKDLINSRFDVADYGDITWIYIDYQLNNGKHIVRDYRVPVDFITETEGYKDIINSPELKKGLDQFLKLDSKDMELYLDYKTQSDEFYCEDIDEELEKSMLWEVIKLDIAKGNDRKDGEYMGGVSINKKMSFNSKEEAEIFSKTCLYCNGFDRVNESSGVYRFHFYVNIIDSMENTCNWIENNLQQTVFESKYELKNQYPMTVKEKP